ncbi:CDP-diacylglycerol--glycerol-3-phosphate 3-phosphatidyltransferase [Williamsoniiplasma somnilux]|uniref:CDP-diacylglycerol--glycerol-3-phosphate 3-phosphatidyltransferase n=1 Tax=Williamsoniiplasma somnilux TaxID=215578 RepID=A0A2K8NXE4_9MOLU|nr:CDP-diacylglycerol--glycerol-3-phosphate 3-phosphatidyltransferase [Williamsoniiplasma somnilux]ATZ18457.1 CDP-diacylglycerol--glycerol-3-phosphate 3-phosphatidyltransferase [Williamsoniiplasma somnilux]
MNWPNRLTLLRLILVPVVIVLILISFYTEIQKGNQWKWELTIDDYHLPILFLAGGLIFVIASLTDFLDGYLARKNNQVTDFGKFFDPIADKLLVNSTLILFSAIGTLPVWITIILILRDIFVDFIRMILSKKGVTLAAGFFGKLKTVFQMFGLSILFFINFKFFNNDNNNLSGEYGLLNQFILIPMYLATIFSIYSGIVYFWKAKPTLFAK